MSVADVLTEITNLEAVINDEITNGTTSLEQAYAHILTTLGILTDLTNIVGTNETNITANTDGLNTLNNTVTGLTDTDIPAIQLSITDLQNDVASINLDLAGKQNYYLGARF